MFKVSLLTAFLQLPDDLAVKREQPQDIKSLSSALKQLTTEVAQIKKG